VSRTAVRLIGDGSPVVDSGGVWCAGGDGRGDEME